MATTDSELDGHFQIVELVFDRQLAMDVFDARPTSHPVFVARYGAAHAVV